MESKKRRHFPDAFKREAVERARTSGLTIVQVAEELGSPSFRSRSGRR